MVTVMLIASPPVVSQTLEDEERKKDRDKQKESYHLSHNLNRKTVKFDILLLFRKTQWHGRQTARSEVRLATTLSSNVYSSLHSGLNQCPKTQPIGRGLETKYTIWIKQRVVSAYRWPHF